MGMPSDYRTQYIAELDMKGRAGKYKKAVKKSAGAKMSRYSK
jgi:hypothetical protein